MKHNCCIQQNAAGCTRSNTPCSWSPEGLSAHTMALLTDPLHHSRKHSCIVLFTAVWCGWSAMPGLVMVKASGCAEFWKPNCLRQHTSHLQGHILLLPSSCSCTCSELPGSAQNASTSLPPLHKLVGFACRIGHSHRNEVVSSRDMQKWLS